MKNQEKAKKERLDIYQLRDRYRNALLEVGRSPDTRIDEVGESIYDIVDMKKDSWKLIMKVKDFYNQLSSFQKDLFYNEYLLREPTYYFWYCITRSKTMHRREKRRLEKHFYENFE